MRIILLLILQISSAVFSEPTINFIPDVSSNNSTLDYTTSGESCVVDAFSERQVLIKMQKLSPLKINCRVSELKEEFAIKEAYLCRRESLMIPATCVNVIKDKGAIFGSSSFDVDFSTVKGFTASLRMEDEDTHLYGYFHCELRNNVDTIISNNVEIHDIVYYDKVIKSSHSPIGTEIERDINDLDTFDCGSTTPNEDVNIPEWLKPSLLDQLQWFICDHDDICLSPITQRYQENDQFQILPNRTLKFFTNALEKFERFNLQCIAVGGVVFSKYVVTDRKHGRRFLTDEIIFSETETTQQMRVQTLLRNDYKLSVAYISKGTTFSWLKDGMSVDSAFSQDKHTLTFPRNIVASHQGVYTLTVRQRSPSRLHSFKFNVHVVDLPKISRGFELPPVSYIMKGQPLNLETKFEGDLSATNLDMNEIKISTRNAKETERDLAVFKEKYNYLSAMKLSVSKLVHNHTTKYIYRARDIDGLWFNKGYSHRISFNAINSIGYLKESTLVKVIKPPKWKLTLDKYNCTDNCFSSQPHFFKCSIYKKEYNDLGMIVRYAWKINDLDIMTSFSSELLKLYFEFEDGVFAIKNIFTSDHSRDLRIIEQFKNATLSCSVMILAPKKAIAGEMKYQQIYDSAADLSLTATLLQTRINIISDHSVRDGSNFLVLMISIPLIVVTVVVTILVCVCYLGRGGKTYDIDQEERNAGKDPEQEMFDGLYFKQYHREEENNTPIVHDTISWSHTSDLKSDIGEIESYESGEGDFDEGSIIGQYGTKRDQ